MVRTNLCPNPGLKNNATGWSGPGGSARVTGVTGMLRTTGFSAGVTNLQPPRAAVTVGLSYRFSAYVKGNGGASTGTCNINWYSTGGYLSSSTAQAWSVADGSVVRVDSLAATAPATAVEALLTIEGIDAGVIVTAVLYEQATTLGTYFDGDSTGGTWTGTSGNSTSTLTDAQSVLPDTVAAPAAPFQPALNQTARILPNAVAAPAAPFNPQIVPGAVTIFPTTVAAPSAPPSPKLQQVIRPDSIAAPSVPNPAVSVGPRPWLRVDFWALDDDGSILCPLPHVTRWDLSLIPGEPGAVRIEYPIDGLNFDVLDERVTRGRDLYIQIRYNGTVSRALAAVLQARDGDEVSEQGTVEFVGSFLTTLLTEGWLPYNDADEKGETTYAAATAGQVMGGVLDATQAAGFCTDLSWTFTDSVDSNGVPWPSDQHVSPTFSPGNTPLKIAQQLQDWGILEFEVTSAFEVRCYVPETVGTDRTLNDPPTVLRRGRDLLSAPRRTDVGDAGTDLLVIGKDGVHVELFDASARSRRGRRVGQVVSEGSLADTLSATVFGTAELSRRVWGVDELNYDLTFDHETSTVPLRDVWPADWVYSDTGGGLTRERVVQLTISMGGNDRLSGGLVLRDLIAERDVLLKRRLDRLQSGSTIVGTSEPPTTEPDAVAPSAPTGLVVSSIAYQDGVNEPTRAVVYVQYVAPTTNTDSTPLTDLGGFQARMRYLGLVQTGTLDPGDPIPDGGAGSWTVSETVDDATTTIAISGVDANAEVEVQVRAFDNAETPNIGPWSAGVEHTTETDTTPPPIPSTPVVSDWFGTLRVEWDGLDEDGAEMRAAAPDFRFCELHVSTTSSFTPSDATLSAVINGATTWNITDLTIGVTWYVRLVAVDRDENTSGPSVQGSAVPRGIEYPDMGADAIDSAQIRDLAVLTAHVGLAQIVDANINAVNVGKLVAGTLSADVILGSNIRTATSGQRMVINSTGWQAYNSASTLFAELNIPTASMLVTGEFRTGLSGERLQLLQDGTMRWYPAAGSDYAEMYNDGAVLRFRSRPDSSNRRSYVHMNPAGFQCTYTTSAGANISQFDLGITYGVINAPVTGIRLYRQTTPADGTQTRFHMLMASASGDDSASVIHYYGRRAGWTANTVTDNTGLFRNAVHANGILMGGSSVSILGNRDDVYGPFTADGFSTPSSGLLKSTPRPLAEQLTGGARAVLHRAPSQAWQYLHDLEPWPDKPGVQVQRRQPDGSLAMVDAEWARPQPVARLHFGPIAEDLHAVSEHLTHRDDQGRLMTDLRDLLGVLWAAVADLDRDHTARLAALENRGQAPMVVDGSPT